MSLAVYVSAGTVPAGGPAFAALMPPPSQDAAGLEAALGHLPDRPAPRGRRLGVRRRVDDLPLALQPRQDTPADLAVELGQDVVQQQDGALPVAPTDDERHRQAQGQGQQPLLPPGGGRPGVGTPEPHRHVVPMRPDPREPAAEVTRPRRRQGVQEGAARGVPVHARGHRRLVAQHHPSASGSQRDLDLADRVCQERQRLEPPVHDLAAQGRELLVPRREQPLGVRPPREVAQEARPLLEHQAVAPACLRVHGHEPGRRAIEIGAPEMGTAREQRKIGRREAYGAGPRAERPSHLDPSLAREQLEPHVAHPAPRGELARHRGPAAGIPAETIGELCRAEGSPGQQDVERLEERRLALAVAADEDVQPWLRSEGEGSVAPKPDQLDPSDVHPGRASPHMRIGIITQRYASSGAPLFSAAPSSTPGLRPSFSPTTVHGWSIGPSASRT